MSSAVYARLPHSLPGHVTDASACHWESHAWWKLCLMYVATCPVYVKLNQDDSDANNRTMPYDTMAADLS